MIRTATALDCCLDHPLIHHCAAFNYRPMALLAVKKRS